VKVSVRLFTTLRELARKAEETIEISPSRVTVKDVLKELVKRYGKDFRDYLYNEEGEIRDHLQLLVNGKSVGLLEELDTRLKEGDHVAIVPPVGGG
jgi:molybdopterin synthase sulfur carrier subunit